MNKTPLSGFYSLSNAAETLAIPRSQLLRYARYDKLPLYMELDSFLPDSKHISIFESALSEPEYGQITIPDDWLNLAISIYETSENDPLFLGFHDTHWFPEQAVKSDGSVITFDKDLYMYSELSFEDVLIKGDELNNLLNITKKVPSKVLETKKRDNSEVSAIEHSDALRILVKLHLGYVPQKPNTDFVRSLEAHITDKHLKSELNTITGNWKNYLHIYRTPKRRVMSQFKNCIKTLAKSYHRPFSSKYPSVKSPDAIWLDEFYKSLPIDDQATLTKEQWRNILG